MTAPFHLSLSFLKWQVEALPELASKGVEPIPTPKRLFLFHFTVSQVSSQSSRSTISETRLDP